MKLPVYLNIASILFTSEKEKCEQQIKIKICLENNWHFIINLQQMCTIHKFVLANISGLSLVSKYPKGIQIYYFRTANFKKILTNFSWYRYADYITIANFN